MYFCFPLCTCVTRWFWELECGYKDEYTSVQQHGCPVRSCSQWHSPPVHCCGNAGRRRCCEFIHIFLGNKHTSISACLHSWEHKHTLLNFVMFLTSMLQNLQVFLDGVSVATLESLMLCYPDRLMVQLNVTPTEIQISGNSSSVTYMKSVDLQEALKRLNSTMQNPVSTYIGGIPGKIKWRVEVLKVPF